MAVLEILRFPDPRLRVQAQPVLAFDSHLRTIAENMRETMYHAQGVGLAATQVGIHQRIFVMDVSESHDELYYIVNPEIVQKSGKQVSAEGCLSVEEAFDKVERALEVHMRGFDLEGNPIELHAKDLMAACIQHEIDHLNGTLFIDHLSRLKQDRIKKKIEKIQRQR